MQVLDDTLLNKLASTKGLQFGSLLGTFCCGSVMDGALFVARCSNNKASQQSRWEFYLITYWR